jgi:hypothetical protein
VEKEHAMDTSQLYLTPSEVVYLHGDQFVNTSPFFYHTRLMPHGKNVAIDQLTQLTLATALVANEQRGIFCFSTAHKKSLFGLVPKDLVSILYNDQPGDWPDDSIEAAMVKSARELKLHQNNVDIYSVIFDWLGNPYPDPFSEVINRIKSGLVRQGLVIVEEKRWFGPFKKQSYSFSAGEQLIDSDPGIVIVKKMVQGFQNLQPVIWQLLLDQVRKAILARREYAYV